MKEINVLILSAGRRVELVQLFKKAALDLKITSKVIAADCSITAPALYFADKKYKLPRINEPRYIDEIIKICKAENVKLIVPTIDTDLLVLSQSKNKIFLESGATVLVSNEKIILICRDKIKTHEFLEKNKFPIPKLYDFSDVIKKKIEYPVFIKPKDGSSSKNTFKANKKIDLDNYLSIVPNPMIQEFVEGEEYTVDIFLDFNSKIISIVPRLRMETRSGEISKGKIIKDSDIINQVKKLMEILKPIGHITVQLMKTVKGIKFIEINPRFGGGAPMSIQSGANSCEYLYRLLLGEELSYNDNYRDNLTFLRFDQSICLEEENMNYD